MRTVHIVVSAICAMMSAQAFSADISWQTTGEGVFNDPANWSGGVVPSTNDVATISKNATVTFPAGGWSQPVKQLLITPPNGGLVTIDTRGTYWELPVSATNGVATYDMEPIKVCSQAFKVERWWVTANAHLKPLAMVSNAVFRSYLISGGSVNSNMFESGLIDISGRRSPMEVSGQAFIVGTGYGSILVVEPEARLIMPITIIKNQANGPNLFRFNGGSHAIYGAFNIRAGTTMSQSGNTRVELDNGTLLEVFGGSGTKSVAVGDDYGTSGAPNNQKHPIRVTISNGSVLRNAVTGDNGTTIMAGYDSILTITNSSAYVQDNAYDVSLGLFLTNTICTNIVRVLDGSAFDTRGNVLMAYDGSVSVFFEVKGSSRISGKSFRGKTSAGYVSLEFDGGTVECSAAGGESAFISDIDRFVIGSGGVTLDTGRRSLTLSLPLLGPDQGTFTVTGGGGVTFAAGSGVPSHIDVRDGYVVGGAGVTVSSLTVGTDDAFGSLKVSADGAIGVSDSLTFKSVRLDVSGITANGDCPVVVLDGEASAELTAKWANLTFVNRVDGKSYATTWSYSAETGKTTFSVTVADASSATGDTVWAGPDGGAWSDGPNWSGGAVPAATSTAVFDATAAGGTVLVPSFATAGGLSFDSVTGYTLSGTGPLRLGSTTPPATAVGSGSHEIAVPLVVDSMMPVDVAEGSVLSVSGDVAGNGVEKVGSGKLLMSGGVELSDGLVVSNGILEVADGASFAANPFTLSGSTLWYSGSDSVTNVNSFELDTTNAAVIFRNDGDVTMADGVYANTRKKGSLIKVGTGKMTVNITSSTAIAPNASGYSAKLVTGMVEFPANGSAPTNGYCGFSIAEGELCFKGGPSDENSARTDAATHFNVGVGTTNFTGPCKLTFDGGAYNFKGSTTHLYVGSYANKGGSNQAHTLEFRNKAYGYVDTIYLGAVGTARTELGTDATLIVDNSWLDFTYRLFYGYDVGKGGMNAYIRNGSTIRCVDANGWGSHYWGRAGTIDVDNSRMLLGAWRSGFDVRDNAAGTMRFRNGSLLELWCLAIRASKAAGCHFVFDGSTFRPKQPDGSLIFMNSTTHTFGPSEGGMTVDVTDETGRYTFRQPLVGSGAVTKTGGGELVFDVAAQAGGYTNNTDVATITNLLANSVTLAATGGITVAEGVLTLKEGAPAPFTMVNVGGAGALNLAGGTVALMSVGGHGVVSNGTLNAAYVCGVEDAGTCDYLVFRDIAAGVKVTFAERDDWDVLWSDYRDWRAVGRIEGTTPATGWRGGRLGELFETAVKVEGGVVYARARGRSGMTLIFR